MNLPVRSFPKPPAQVEPYVAALGIDLTVEFLLKFGGAVLYVPENPKGSGRLEALIGAEKVQALAALDYLLPRRVPLANPWLSACLHAMGYPVAEIARKVRASESTVRTYLQRYSARSNAP